MLLFLAAADIGVASSRPQWVWSKSWTEHQLRKHFPSTTVLCDPVGPPSREVGYNAYAEFACTVALRGGADYALVLKPRGRVAWITLSIKRMSSEPQTGVPEGRQAVGNATGRGAYLGAGSSHPIINKALDGSLLTLKDGSRWLINPLAQYATVLWLVTDNVAVLKGIDPNYPYQLVNTRDSSAASARFLG